MKVAAVVQSLEGPDESDDLQVKWHSDKSVGESGSIGSLISPSPPMPIILLTAAPNSLYLFPFRNSRRVPHSDATDISTDITACPDCPLRAPL